MSESSSTSQNKQPEWAPKGGGEGFNSIVMSGVEGGHEGMPGNVRKGAPFAPKRRRKLELEDYVEGIKAGNRTRLGQAITLVESNAKAHQELAQNLLEAFSNEQRETLRVGITGVPGAGKSTTIDALGEYLCGNGHKVAVLAVDPSSKLTGGSILGDKTRMERLARNPCAFIRPSPTGGCLGGVARKTKETIVLCEAFGFDVILLETVGVGQSEVTVRSMVDFFMLVLIAGAGDELQGIKKGVIELADAIVVNKADGDNEMRARMAKAEYTRVLSFLQPATPGWKSRSHLLSALTGRGLPELWQLVTKFKESTQESGFFEQRRKQQNLDWLQSLIEEGVFQKFMEIEGIKAVLDGIAQQVSTGGRPVVKEVESLLNDLEIKYR